jgi:hypothetical protein
MEVFLNLLKNYIFVLHRTTRAATLHEHISVSELGSDKMGNPQTATQPREGIFRPSRHPTHANCKLLTQEN